MSHHVFLPKKPARHHVGFAVLVGTVIGGVVIGWAFTTGRAVLANVAAAQQDLGSAVQAARDARDKVVPPADPTPAPEPAAVEPTPTPAPNFDPVIQQMKQKLEADQATTN